MQRYIYVAIRLGLTALGVGCALLSCSIETPMTPIISTPLKSTIISPIEEQTLESLTSVIERSTDTPHPTSIGVLSTPTAMVGLSNSLILYTTVVDMRISANRPADVAPYDDYWGFRTLPSLSFLDPTIFDILYGKSEYADDMELFFLNFRPQLSPNGRYILVPGLAGYPEYGVEGTGTWLIDLGASTTRQLLPDGVIATWNPTSDAITYVDGDTLYKLSIAEGAIPTPLFQDADLSPLYAKWSPDGQWIATLTFEDPVSIDSEEPKYAAAYWLVPTDGGPARKLAVREAFAIEYISGDMSWSADGQYLLVRREVFDLQGNFLSPDYPGRVAWLPNDAHLLLNSREGLRIITIAGEEVARISDTYANHWAFSHDGKRLAYTQGAEGEPTTIAVYDLERGESQLIAPAPAALLRWSADDSRLIVGVFQDSRYEIWALEPKSNATTERLLENAELIEVASYPPAGR